MPSFYIELPADEYGNTALPRAVFEGRIVECGPDTHPFTRRGAQALLIDGPPEVSGYAGMYTSLYGGFAEAEGPARLLTREEHEAIVRSLAR